MRRLTASTSTPRRVPQWRQSRRQPVVEVGPPQAERSGEALARASLREPRLSKLCRHLGVEGVLARLVELVHGAGLAELGGELGGGLGGQSRLVQKGRELVGGNRRVVGAACVGGTPQGRLDGAQLRLPEAILGDLPARRQRQDRDDVDEQTALDLEIG
jgi:hypothetical protein